MLCNKNNSLDMVSKFSDLDVLVHNISYRQILFNKSLNSQIKTVHLTNAIGNIYLEDRFSYDKVHLGK